MWKNRSVSKKSIHTLANIDTHANTQREKKERMYTLYRAVHIHKYSQHLDFCISIENILGIPHSVNDILIV